MRSARNEIAHSPWLAVMGGLCLAAPAGGDTITIRRGSAIAVERALSQENFANDPDLRVFDLNMDGLDDMVARNSDGAVEVVLASTQIEGPTIYDIAIIESPVPLGALFQGNFDRDSFKELLARVAGGVAVISDAAGPSPTTPTTIINVNAIGDAFNMSVADCDGDGDDDLVVNRTASGADPGARAFVYRNDTPAGQNTAPAHWVQTDSISLAPAAFAQEFSSVSAGQLNGDTHVDLLFVSAQNAKCVIMGGNGNDTFEPLNTVTGALVPGGDPSIHAIDMGPSPFRGLVEDLDDDGADDLVVLGGGFLNVRFGNGNGTFGALTQTPTPTSSYPLTGDVDGNGTRDIVTLVEVSGAVSQWDSLSITKVNADRTLQTVELLPTIFQPRSAGFLRINPSDDASLLVGGSGQIALHRSIAGELRSFQRIREETGGGGVRELVVGDLTGDGYADAWFSTFAFGNRVLVNPGDGSGQLGQTLIPGQGTSNAAPAVFVARPAIGRGAIGFATNATDTFNIMAVNDEGTQLQYLTFVAMPVDALDVIQMRYSSDGQSDLDDFALLHPTGNPGISILSQQNDGSFAVAFTSFDLSASIPAVGWWTKFAAFDDSFSKGVMVTGPGGAGMYVEGEGAFSFFPVYDASFSGGVFVAAGDVNGDGRADAVVGRNLGGNTGALSIAMQTGAAGPPTFANPVTTGLAGVPTSIDLADIDSDSDLDIVALTNNGAATMQRTAVLRNDGTGQFPAAGVTEHPTGQSPTRIVLADLNNPVATVRGVSQTTAPEIIQGSRGPNAFFGVQIYDNLAHLAPPSCPGDADGNGQVNFADTTSVLTYFGTDYTPGTGEGDADRNGVVNFADITSVLTFFAVPCP